MSDENPAREPEVEDARIDALERRLKAAKEREDARNQPPAGNAGDANYRVGSKVLSELIGGLVGGVFIGWVIDQVAGTSPWGLLVMMFLGIFVAFRNIIRISNRPND